MIVVLLSLLLCTIGFVMKNSLKLNTFQIGAPPKRAEGLRLGTTRRPPRGVPRARWQRDGYFDVWFPIVAPSASLIRRTRRAKDFDSPAAWQRFFKAYERKMKRTEPRQAIEMLAALAKRTPIAIGCYCEDENRCHRSRLFQLITRAVSQSQW
jgi:uncharacterized protein YeaO (DUF488 family)